MGDSEGIVKETEINIKREDMGRSHTIDVDYNSTYKSSNVNNSMVKNVSASHMERINRRGSQIPERRCRSLETNHDMGGKKIRNLVINS